MLGLKSVLSRFIGDITMDSQYIIHNKNGENLNLLGDEIEFKSDEFSIFFAKNSKELMKFAYGGDIYFDKVRFITECLNIDIDKNVYLPIEESSENNKIAINTKDKTLVIRDSDVVIEYEKLHEVNDNLNQILEKEQLIRNAVYEDFFAKKKDISDLINQMNNSARAIVKELKLY